MLLLTSCGGGGSGDTAVPDTGSAAFSIRKSGDSGMQRREGEIDCEADGIAEIKAEVMDENGHYLVSGGPWECSARSGLIENIPAGTGRKIQVRGYSAAGQEYYKGEVDNITIHGGHTTDAGTVVVDGVYDVTVNYLQYRTFGDGSGNYRASFHISKAGKPVSPSEIAKIEMKNSAGAAVSTQAPSYLIDTYYSGAWNAADATVTFSEKTQYSMYISIFRQVLNREPEITHLPLGLPTVSL